MRRGENCYLLISKNREKFFLSGGVQIYSNEFFWRYGCWWKKTFVKGSTSTSIHIVREKDIFGGGTFAHLSVFVRSLK